MTRRAELGRALLSALTVLALLLLMAAPAGAAHNESHDKSKTKEERQADTDSDSEESDHDGDADGDSDTEYTEDNDTNDGDAEDVADDDDNRHPSGKDRSVESGDPTSNPNQGKAESDPDDDTRGPDRTNGGPDKPNGSGGFDLADQDGNNGCGNDDDFEDDNEGWCVRILRVEDQVDDHDVDCDDAASHDETKDCEDGDDVKGNSTVTVDVDCYTVKVTSTKDISNVEVAFADGTVVKYEGLSGYTWSKTFTTAVLWAKAKSGTTVVYSSSSADCDEDEVEGDGEVIEEPCDANKDMPGTQPCDDVPGNSTVDVDVDCYTVSVTSTKDISNVEVAFEDGTVVKFDGLNGHSWTKTFDEAIDWAKAKSGTTVVYESNSEDCDEDDVEGDDTPCDADEDMAGTQPCEEVPCDADKKMPGVQPCDTDDGDCEDVDSHETDECDEDDVEGDDTDKPCDADKNMAGVQPCDDDKPCDADKNMPGTQPCDKDEDDVEGDDTDKPCDEDATMPGTQPCDEDDVEGDHDVEDDEDEVAPGNEDDGGEGNTPPFVLGEQVHAEDGAVAAAGERDSSEDDVLGAVLPFTGASLAAFLFAALTLIAGGFSLLRRK